jgi:predicted house-cleaning noncanonical NTP pyrophosphatase (MazG superfamily)
MRVAHHKLVRDQIPQIIAADGGRPVTRVLDQASYRAALRAKLLEEAREARKHRTGGWHRSWLTSWKYSRPSPRHMT